MVFAIIDAATDIISSAAATISSRGDARKSYSDAASGTSATTTGPKILHPQLSEATANIELWQRKLAERDATLRKLQEEVANLVEREANMKAELVSSTAARTKLFTEHTVLRTTCEDTKRSLATLTERHQRDTEMLKIQAKTHAEQEHQLQRLCAEHSDTLRELDALRLAHQHMQSLLDTRTTELRDAQAYLSKADKIAHAEVQRMVENLNAQVFQLAALVTDSFTFR